jgi:hypothetical protein
VIEDITNRARISLVALGGNRDAGRGERCISHYQVGFAVKSQGGGKAGCADGRRGRAEGEAGNRDTAAAEGLCATASNNQQETERLGLHQGHENLP